ncbi:MAG: GAF domain-containing protein [Leptolyngbyaceae cyanobacterium]
MTSSPHHRAANMLATLTNANPNNTLTHRVKDLPVPKFIGLLDQITGEFQHYLQVLDLIKNDSMEGVLEQILEAFTFKIGQVLQADRTTIFLIDEDKDELWAKVAQGEGETRLTQEIRMPKETGIAGHVAITGQPLNIPDAYNHPLFNHRIDQKTGYHTRNILCMPVFSNSDNRVVAVVQLLNKAGDRPFDETDEAQFRTFADSIGIILESCTSFYVAARNQRGVHSLLRATACLAQSLDLNDTLQSVMDEARKLMQADRSTLFLLDQEREELWTTVADANGVDMIDIRLPWNRGIAGYVASTHQVLNIPNAYEDPRFDPATDRRTGYHTRNILCMPVFDSAGKLIGVTQLINKKQGNFNYSDEEFMEAFNVQAGIALENAQLFERVLQEEQYQRDILSSLSDAVISTNLQGEIVTINDAALELLGCPVEANGVGPPILSSPTPTGVPNPAAGRPWNQTQQQFWREKLLGQLVWDCIPLDSLQFRLGDSLETAARHYVPEQILLLNLQRSAAGLTSVSHPDGEDVMATALAIPDGENRETFWVWGDRTVPPLTLGSESLTQLERNINLTVNPLTNPDGEVRGGLVVLEDISQEKRMKATMYRYMNPKVAEQAMSLGDDALQVSERKPVSILFSDIRGYTALTEGLDAPEVVALLNEYFGTMVEAVFNHEGTLDKFIGDALMAVFGAPLPLADHAWMTILTALEMRQRLAVFNACRSEEMKIKIGIGISSGEVVSGNIGSQKRMDYTVIGNAVDISSRLEGLTKYYGSGDRHGCDIIFSEDTLQLLDSDHRDLLYFRELDRIRVKGKQCPVTIYELLGDRTTPLDATTNEFLGWYGQGRTAYNQGQFATALTAFEQAHQLRPKDQATLIHIERIQGYLLSPPPQPWDGVHTMTTK